LLGERQRIRDYVASLRPADYNEFNLLFGDATGLDVGYSRRDSSRVEVEIVPPGVHVVPNAKLDSAEFPKVERAVTLAKAALVDDWPTSLAALTALLSDHEMPALEQVEAPPSEARFSREQVRKLHALCIHTEYYGTRSSNVVALAPGRTAHYFYSERSACQSPLNEATHLLSGD
jgi:uncharacterized protein with NRDE domain